jgi:type I restriction enzyme M protein
MKNAIKSKSKGAPLFDSLESKDGVKRSSRITQAQLESYLWGAATRLRGVIDAGDYKQFIFPLLFFKRLSDVYNEEYEQALVESDGDVDFAKFAENHRFQVPEGAHWRDVRNTSTNVGKALQNAMRAIETANPKQLYGIFGDAQWTNKDRLADATMRDLIEHFSTLTLSVANVPEDELGQAYEYLIKKFADDSGHTAAEFYTNRTLVHLMTLMLDPQPGESIYDPTCGSGGMLLSAAMRLKQEGKEYRTLKLYGQERNLMTSAIARMNLFLHNIEDFRIERGDTLADPKFLEGDRLRQFDMVLANPPYSIKQWDRAAWESDPHGRNLYGVPPQGRADYAFFQHIIESLKPDTGRCAILFPHGVLFRDEEKHMRIKLVKHDTVECVLGLGPNLFYNSPMEACVVVCRKRKAKERRRKILFINAVDEVTRERAQSFLKEEHINRILQAYRDYKDVDGFAHVASLDDIRGNDYSLNIPLYVQRQTSANGKEAGKGEKSLSEVIADWEKSSKTLRASMNELFSTLREAGIGS